MAIAKKIFKRKNVIVFHSVNEQMNIRIKNVLLEHFNTLTANYEITRSTISLPGRQLRVISRTTTSCVAKSKERSNAFLVFFLGYTSKAKMMFFRRNKTAYELTRTCLLEATTR